MLQAQIKGVALPGHQPSIGIITVHVREGDERAFYAMLELIWCEFVRQEMRGLQEGGCEVVLSLLLHGSE